MTKTRRSTVLAAAVMAAALTTGLRAQVGTGLDDLNALSAASLAALPGMNQTIADAFVEARPFNSIVDANAFLLGRGLTQAQLTSIYERAFVHINLNASTAEEVALIPRAAGRMAREFAEYRPWVNFAQFDREIGKYVGEEETNRLKQYVFIPLDLNASTREQFMTIPNVGANMMREFEEYRPWRTKEQFDREISKYVGDQETARLWRYMVIN